jgi:PAS domain S-box-containing protein
MGIGNSPATLYLVLASLAATLAVFAVLRSTRFARRAAQSQAQLALVLDNIAEGIVVLDLNRNILLMSKVGAGLLSLDNNSLSYAQVEEQFECFSIGGEVLPRDQWPSARALRGDFVHDLMVRYRRKDDGAIGSRWISTAPVPGFTGPDSRIILTHHDDSGRERSDEACLRLAAIVESCHDAIIGKDAAGIVTSWNSGAEAIFGYTCSEMIGSPIKRLLPPERLYEEDEILKRILRDESVDHLNSTRITKDGRTIHVCLTISPIKDSSGRIVGASKIARDITQTRNFERQLLHCQKMEAIGQLTGGIAHDFNNLLGIVVGNLDLLEGLVAADPSALCRTRTAQKAAARCSDLTRRLLAFSSNERLKPVATDLRHSIRNIMEMSAGALGPQIELSTDFANSDPPVFVDPAGLETALLNLLVNARDAMPNGGSVKIATRSVQLDGDHLQDLHDKLAPGTYALVSVTDNGQGMSRETLERAFEPFFTTKERGRGTGLGLPMVYGFARQSHGTVHIYSEPGLGTTVSLYLPVAHGYAPVFPSIPVASGPLKIGGTVLLVDDEAGLLDIASAFLNKLGYTTLVANDAAQALRVLAETPQIDLMLTDIIMPGGMNGVDLARTVRELMPSIKIIYTSGFPSDALALKNFTLEGGTLLNKPYRLAELGAAINLAMSEREDLQPAPLAS